MSYQIKICGLTNREDIEFIARAGADFGGLLINIDSARALRLEQALPLCQQAPLPLVAVTLDRNEKENAHIANTLHPTALQLHGHEPPRLIQSLKQHISCEIWKVIHLPAHPEEKPTGINALLQQMEEYAKAGTDRFILDAMVMDKGQRKLGGTGKKVDWKLAREIREQSPRPLFLAGGIQPGNAVQALREVQPFGIDLSSGVESTKGKKDPHKVLQLLASVREFQSPEISPRNNPAC